MNRETLSLVARFVLPICFAGSIVVSCPRVVLGAEDLLRINQEFPSDDELPYLPRYCWARMKASGHWGNDFNKLEPAVRAEITRWEKILDPKIFVHLHHYCGGINRVRRYWLSVNRDGRDVGELGELRGRQRMTLEAALSEFKYVKGYMEKYKSILYPDLLVNEATAYWQLGDKKKATADLLSAIKVKTDYGPPYLLLSKILEEENKVQEAETVLRLGLEKTNGASSLKTELNKLKGK